VNILSIQSWVAYGHVGNAAALFPLQRLGAEVWGVHTVQFSNHTGYPGWTGEIFTPQSIGALVAGIAQRGVLSECDAVLSGYLGSADIGTAILEAVATVRAANSSALYCCDPVIGDVGRGVFVRPGVPEFFRDHAVPQADLLTPNAFELAHLTGMAPNTLTAAKRAVAALQARMHADGPRVVAVTSLRIEDTPDDAIDLLAGAGGTFWRVRTPLLPIAPNGAGDLTAALMLYHWLATGSAAKALERTASAVFAALRRTVEAGRRELAIIEAQDEIVDPGRRFIAEAC
jgi:pyridoxine kinase